jgi:hypothetical protein
MLKFLSILSDGENMIEELQKVKNKVPTLISHINKLFLDKEIRNLDYSSIDEAISIVGEFVYSVNLKKYRFSYTFVFAFSNLTVKSKIHLLITKKKVIHKLGGIDTHLSVKSNVLLLNLNVRDLTFDERIRSVGILKEIANRKNLKFSNTVTFDGKHYSPSYFIEIPLKAELLEYVI